MILEVVAVVVYPSVFNTVAKVLFVRKFSMQISSEKLGLAYEICVVSLIGAIHFDQAVFPLWVLTAVIVQYCRGVQWAMVTGAVAAVFWKCQFSPDAELFIYIFSALTAGWFLTLLIDVRYRKTVLALSVFAVSAAVSSQQVYGIAAAMAMLSLCLLMISLSCGACFRSGWRRKRQ